MEVIQGGKEKKETVKQAKERREKVGFEPRNKDVLLDIIDIKPRAMASGIHIPESKEGNSLDADNYWEHPFQAYVVDGGPDVREDIKVGQKVAFRPPGNPIRDKGHTYALVSDYDIIGFLE